LAKTNKQTLNSEPEATSNSESLREQALNYGSAVPDFDFTNKISARLRKLSVSQFRDGQQPQNREAIQRYRCGFFD
jgi:hypothetical protein